LIVIEDGSAIARSKKSKGLKRRKQLFVTRRNSRNVASRVNGDNPLSTKPIQSEKGVRDKGRNKRSKGPAFVKSGEKKTV